MTLVAAVAVIVVAAGVFSSFTRKQRTEILDTTPHYSVGNKYLAEQKYEEAVVALTAAIEDDPKRTDSYIDLIDAYVGVGDMNGVAETYKQASRKLTGRDLRSVEMEYLAAQSLLASSKDRAVRIPIGATVGDIVTIGVYEQDGDMLNGAESIEWIVMDEDEDGLLLISRYVLDNQQYQTGSHEFEPWETCSLRTWLNNEFYNVAFSQSEQAAIRTTNVVNSDHPATGAHGGFNTEDKLFSLSVDEIRRYYIFSMWDEVENYYGYSEQLIAEPTPYAIDHDIDYSEMTQEQYERYYEEKNYPASVVGRVGADWWTRSPGLLNGHACKVSEDGRMGVATGYLDESGGVRPAMWVFR